MRYSIGYPTKAESLSEIIDSLLGRPYRERGIDVRGFYCLGFAVYVLNRWTGFGLRDPLTSPESWRDFRSSFFEVEEELVPGDMLLVSHPRPSRQHVGIVESPQWVADCNAIVGSVGRSRLSDWLTPRVTAHRLKT